jgi:MFS family permease
MVAIAFAIILLGAGTRAAPGALLLPIQADTGWTNSQVTITGALGLLLLGLGGPALGALIDRFGVRRPRRSSPRWRQSFATRPATTRWRT